MIQNSGEAQTEEDLATPWETLDADEPAAVGESTTAVQLIRTQLAVTVPPVPSPAESPVNEVVQNDSAQFSHGWHGQVLLPVVAASQHGQEYLPVPPQQKADSPSVGSAPRTVVSNSEKVVSEAKETVRRVDPTSVTAGDIA